MGLSCIGLGVVLPNLSEDTQLNYTIESKGVKRVNPSRFPTNPILITLDY
jgi:hypothetical protein